jgi:UDP-N-acetylglucosamine 1-carboxyvinyltransferase
MMAAALTPGETVVTGAAREPEVVALAEMLNQMGAKIDGAGTPTLAIRGAKELGGCKVKLIGDRIEAGTYLLAGAAAGGHIKVAGFAPDDLGDFKELLLEAGAELECGENSVELRAPKRLNPLQLRTGPFPRFATDLQAPTMAALTVASGVSTIEENIFEGRFGHVSELCRMGAKITLEGRTARIQGIERLSGAQVEGFDIRGAVALIVAGLAANGVTKIFEVQHLRRGYDSLEQKIAQIGGRIVSRQEDPEDLLCTGC